VGDVFEYGGKVMGKNLEHFRYVGECNSRFAGRLGISLGRLRELLNGMDPADDTELEGLAARLGIYDWELFMGRVVNFN
jgi:hypothetical protein